MYRKQLLVVKDYISDVVSNAKCSVFLRICLIFLFLDALHSFMLDKTEDKIYCFSAYMGTRFAKSIREGCTFSKFKLAIAV